MSNSPLASVTLLSPNFTKGRTYKGKTYAIDTVVMGSDWTDDPRFECLRDYCEVVYLDRTQGISTTQIKKELNLPQEELFES